MENSLIPIKGISKATETKLAAQGIPDIPALLEKAGTTEARLELAAKIKSTEKLIYSWVKQGELLRVSGMTADTADLLVKIGVRDVEDLAHLNIEIALPLMKSVSDGISPAIKDFPTKEKLIDIKNRAILMTPAISRDYGEPTSVVVLLPHDDQSPEDNAVPATPSSGDDYFYDVGDVISSVGRGIADAQHALDMNAIMTQQQINNDDDLRVWGVSAQWYTIPEATVNLKMNYQIIRESVEEGTIAAGTRKETRLLVSPINAKYTNTFKVSETLQSELNLKFLPIPAPTRWTEQIIVPNFIGMTLAETKEQIAAIGMKLGSVKLEEGVSESDGVVASQSPLEDARVWLTEKLHICLTAPVVKHEPEPDHEPVVVKPEPSVEAGEE